MMIDLAAMQADDALLDGIGSGAITFDTAPTDDQLTTFLTHWRAAILASPIPELITPTEARALILAAAEPLRQPHRSYLILYVLAAWLLGMVIIISVIVWFAR